MHTKYKPGVIELELTTKFFQFFPVFLLDVIIRITRIQRKKKSLLVWTMSLSNVMLWPKLHGFLVHDSALSRVHLPPAFL